MSLFKIYIIAYKYKNLSVQYFTNSRDIGKAYTLNKDNAKSFSSLEEAKVTLRSLLNKYEYHFCKNFKSPFFIQEI